MRRWLAGLAVISIVFSRTGSAGTPPLKFGAEDVITYSAQPNDGDALRVNAVVFEFDSGDGVATGNVAVSIGADEHATFGQLANAIGANVSEVTATANAATSMVVLIAPSDPLHQLQVAEVQNTANSFALHFLVGLSPVDLVAGDFNHDGNPDIATANNDSSDISVLWGNGDGTFLNNGVTYATGDFPVAIAAGHVSSAANLDLVVANDGSANVSLLVGTGAGPAGPAFSAPIDTDSGDSPNALVLADFNGDGKLDVATAEPITSGIEGGSVTVRLNGPSGQFGAAIVTGVGGGPWGLAAADFDGDGKMDLVVTNHDSTTVTVLFGNGDGTFPTQAPLSVEAPSCLGLVSPAAVAAADLNGDGKSDIVSTNEDCDTVAVLLNDGHGNFSAATFFDVFDPITATGYPTGVRIAHLNGDGKPDIAVVNYDGSVAILAGHGDGTFEPAAFFPVDGGPTAVAVADVNHDCVPDILTANQDGDTVAVLLNEWPGLNESPGGCTGDCDGSGSVTVDELVRGVNIVLGTAPLSECMSFDKDKSCDVTVDELVMAVNNLLGTCTA